MEFEHIPNKRANHVGLLCMNDIRSTLVPDDVLHTISGDVLFYPSSGNDIEELVTSFLPVITKFWFCDLMYMKGMVLPPAITEDIGFRIEGKSELLGNPNSVLEEQQPDRPYRHMEPSILKEVYVHEASDNTFEINRRRGFGQYAIAKFSNKSIGVFVHRGDSMVEGGSGVFYLANKKAKYEPLGKLFDKLSTKLADTALIVTDGSNCQAKFLKKFNFYNDISGAEAYEYHRDKDYRKWGFIWACVGYLSNKNGPTLIWLVSRI